MKMTQTTDLMTVLEIFPEDPASVLLSEFAEDAQGQCRAFQQRVFVPSRDLLHRLVAEAEIGGNIEATLITEWKASSSTVRLADFCVAPVSALPSQRRAA